MWENFRNISEKEGTLDQNDDDVHFDTITSAQQYCFMKMKNLSQDVFNMLGGHKYTCKNFSEWIFEAMIQTNNINLSHIAITCERQLHRQRC